MHCRGLDVDIFVLKCRMEFEPHGRATETWEEVWYLYLPTHQYHWVNIHGKLVRGKEGLTQSFKGKTDSDVIDEAILWLEKFNCDFIE